jgi:hypothetical protein
MRKPILGLFALQCALVGAWSSGFFPVFALLGLFTQGWMLRQVEQFKKPMWGWVIGFAVLYFIGLRNSPLLTWVNFIFLGSHVLNIILIKFITQRWELANLYALSPFVLFETMGRNAQGCFWVTIALALIWGHQYYKNWALAGGLTMAFALNPWSLFFLPLFCRKNWRWPLAISIILSGIFLYLSFERAQSFHQWAYSDFEAQYFISPYGILTLLFGPGAPVIWLLYTALLLFFVVLVGGTLQEQLWQFLRCSLWWGPFFYPSLWVVALTCALCSGKKFTFVLIGAAVMLLHQADFYGLGHSSPMFWMALPLFGLLLMSEWRLRHHIFRHKGEWVDRFSVVTPVLNEAENLRELGNELNKYKEFVAQWIVVDAGSSDDSLQIAEHLGALVLSPGLRGRGPQISAGVEASQQDWIVVIHADTRLGPRFFEELQATIGRVPSLDGGAFSMIYRGEERLGVLRFLNDLKTRWLGISFGDQCQFFHRGRLSKRGGFPKLALMEDLELSLMWKGGAVAYITSSHSSTSPRRWKTDGRLKNALLIIKLLLIYLIQRHWAPPVDVTQLYRRYYPKK